MQKVKRLRYLLLSALVLSMVACQKEQQEQLLPKDEILSVSEKVIVPETGNLSGTVNRENKKDYNTFYGPQVQMGNGHVRSWINITRKDDLPLAIGIEFTSNSFENLPTADANIEDHRFDLKLHQKAMAVTPFDHLTLNWEPEGHPPFYFTPHFDMHFYKISIAQQNTITDVPGPAPAPGYLPLSYVIRGATVPQMGTHWLDPRSPEFPPTSAPFTHTFIYGSNNGNVHFLEPMITRDFLVSGTSFSTPFPQPLHFSPSGTYYPTWYRIWKDSENGRSYVALTDFVWR
ncbi:MAG: hypothetical protein ACR2KX_04715 [Chitinophagaceae bacterium]